MQEVMYPSDFWFGSSILKEQSSNFAISDPNMAFQVKWNMSSDAEKKAMMTDDAKTYVSYIKSNNADAANLAAKIKDKYAFINQTDGFNYYLALANRFSKFNLVLPVTLQTTRQPLLQVAAAPVLNVKPTNNGGGTVTPKPNDGGSVVQPIEVVDKTESEDTEKKIMGLRTVVFIPVVIGTVVLIGGGILVYYKYFKNKK